MFGEQLVVLLQLYCLLSMEFSVVLKGSLDVLDADAGRFEFFIQKKSLFLGCLEVVLGLFSALFKFWVKVFYHVSEVSAEMVNVIVLQLYLFGDAFSKRGYIFENFAALLHPDVQYLKFLFHILGGFLYLSW